MRESKKMSRLIVITLSLVLSVASIASAGVSKVLCVPWQGDPNKPHTAISGQAVDLYAVIYGDSVGGSYTYSWDLKNGTTKTGTISVPGNGIYNLKVTDTFTGSLAATFNTTLTVGAASDDYKVIIAENSNDSKVNIAIDKGLWYIHTGANRYNGGTPSVAMANWGSNNTNTMVGVAGANVWAFEVQGHNLTVEAAPLAPVEDPYVEDVQRGINFILSSIASVNLSNQDGEDPDSNGNGIGLFASHDSYNNPYSGHTNYENGLAMGAIAGSGTPAKTAATGIANVNGRTYLDIVQDLADWYVWSQIDDANFPPSQARGGWYYYANTNYSHPTYGDNSSSQWAYIGLEAAKSFGATIPAWSLKRLAGYLHGQIAWNSRGFVSYRANEGTGNVCLTGGALVGMALVGKDLYESQNGAGAFDTDMNLVKVFMGNKWRGTWDRWEKNWYGGYWSLYTMYAAMKGFRVNGIDALTAAPGTTSWYNDYVGTLLTKQATNGSWSEGYDGYSGWMENSYLNNNMKTAFGVLILTPSVFTPPPNACFTISPNPGYTGIPIQFNPACSYHADNTKQIVKYEWDWNSDGTYEDTDFTTTPDIVTHQWPDGTPLGNYPVTLRVTDNTTPTPVTDTMTINFELTLPPHPPVAITGGPYTTSLCAGDVLNLDGSASFDIDAGKSESGVAPFDGIIAWNWDLNGAPWDYSNKSGEKVALVAADISALFPTAKLYDIGLKVTDNTLLAYPGSGKPNQPGEAFGKVDVKTGCLCTIKATPKSGVVQLNWSGAPTGSQTYDIYRSTTGPNSGFEIIAPNYSSPYQVYQDRTVANGTVYYYRVALKGASLCMSSSVKAKPVALIR